MINSINDRDTSEAITIARTPAMAWLENHQRTATQSTYHSTFHMFHSTPSFMRHFTKQKKRFRMKMGREGEKKKKRKN